MKRVDAEFKRRVYELVASIPKGRVMTYGQVAALCGAAWAAWEVGQIAHHGPQYIHIASDCLGAKPPAPRKLSAQRVVANSSTHSPYQLYDSFRASLAPSAASKCEYCGGPVIPWWRVVNKKGGLARGYTTGGLEAHKRDLEAEGVGVTDEYKVDVEELLWWPQAKGQNSLPL